MPKCNGANSAFLTNSDTYAAPRLAAALPLAGEIGRPYFFRPANALRGSNEEWDVLVVNASIYHKFRALLFTPVDIASLVVFRIAFGGIMIWEVFRYFDHGWIEEYWIKPAFHFTYPGFHWIAPWQGNGMYIHMAVLGILAGCITLGAFYRISTMLFFLGFTYTFLLEQTRYLNHLYFVCLVSFLLIFMPAHRAFSIDAWLRPKLRTSIVPFWPLWLLRTQLAIVYIYAGFAKFNSDWFRGEPVRTWLQDKRETPIVGWLFEHDATFYFICYTGLAFDLFIVPFLLWKKTRAIAFLAALAFHLSNYWFFNIGIFPWFSIAMTTLFFEPDWPRRFVARWKLELPSSLDTPPSNFYWQHGSRRHEKTIITFVSIYAALQILIPFRHWLYPGDVTWTEEGHQFSWRMKLRSKSGAVAFVVTNPITKESWIEDPDDYLEPWQVSKLPRLPELIRQFAHYLADLKQRELGVAVEVRARTSVKLNDRPPLPLVDPSVDLAKESYRIGPTPWITRPPGPSTFGATTAHSP